MFKFRSGTNVLNDELGRRRGKSDDRQCQLYGDECEGVVHVLWECPAYDTIRNTFVEDLANLLGGSFEELVHSIVSFERTVLGCENWERYDFEALSRLVKSLIWETRKNKLYGDRDGTGETSGCSCSSPLTGDLSSSTCICGCVVDGVSVTAAT